MFCALTDNTQIFFKVEFEHSHRVFNIKRRCRNRDQRQTNVGAFDSVFNPFLVNRDVALVELKARIGFEFFNTVGVDVHAEYFPVGFFEYAGNQVRADKAVYSKNKYFHL